MDRKGIKRYRGKIRDPETGGSGFCLVPLYEASSACFNGSANGHPNLLAPQG